MSAPDLGTVAMKGKHFILRASVLVGLAVLAPSVFAQTQGCADSPENPTAILGLLGIGAAGVPWLRGQLSRLRNR
jgi:XrtJ-associated TM-motif-TM protein